MSTQSHVLARRSCLLLLVLACCVGAAEAQGVQVTSGYLDMQFTSGPLLIGGERGFTLDSAVASADGVFGPAACNASPSSCVPGATVDLTALWAGADVRGSATLDGRRFTSLGSTAATSHVTVSFSGALRLPAQSGVPLTSATPFTFSGTFDHLDSDGAPIRDTLVGGGTATVSLVPSGAVPGGWSIARVLYAFDDQVPAGWVSADIGAIDAPGQAHTVGAQLAVSGAGADIWGAHDAFHFLFQSLPSNGLIVTRVDAISASHPFAKAGVMMRSDAGSDAAHVILDVKPNGELELMTRQGNGQATTYLRGVQLSYPAWLKLQKQDDVVSAFYSHDGLQWNALGTTTVSGLRYAGLVVTSHETARLADAEFSQAAVQQAAAASGLTEWADADVGAVGTPGSTAHAQSTFTVRGSGMDIWGAADGFRFVYQPLQGDGGVAARVTSLQNSHTFAKAGLMIRNSLAADAAHVVLDVRPGGDVEFMVRMADGSETSYRAGAWTAFPGWLQLVRRANTFTGYVSSDGVSWTPVGSVVVALGNLTWRGLVVTSHDVTRATEATFDHVLAIE